MASKWHGQPCPLCGLGTLHDGIKTAVQEYNGYSFSSKNHGVFCDQCADGAGSGNVAHCGAVPRSWTIHPHSTGQALK